MADIFTFDGDEEEAVLDDTGVVYNITTSGADLDVEGLVRRFDKQTIFRPDFQRQFVWSLPQASRFIESILIGLPIPNIFLFKEGETQKMLIVDGLQRLTTLSAFKEGNLPDSDRIFRLSGVKSAFEGKSFKDLDEPDQLRFENAIIHAIVIQQASPATDQRSVYHIFERLNTGGTPLQPQEMRAAISHGKFQTLLEDLNKNKHWRDIFGAIDKRGKDQEHILRFLAMRFSSDDYKRPIRGFLNKFMARYRNPTDEQLKEFRDSFENTISRIHSSLGETAFRPERSFNVSFYEALMVAVAKDEAADSNAIKNASDRLTADPDFRELTSKGTGEEMHVNQRLKKAQDALYAAEHSAYK